MYLTGYYYYYSNHCSTHMHFDFFQDFCQSSGTSIEPRFVQVNSSSIGSVSSYPFKRVNQ